MINIKNITIRNFMSVGNNTQSIILDEENLVLVLGQNVDMGSNGSKNGVGKSSILNAITYALFGSALPDIKLDNLINKTNGKNMMVTLEFTKDSDSYRIERGRKPQVFNIFVNGVNMCDNDAQGDSRLTQQDLENVLGMNKTIFANIIGLNTDNVPFLTMKASEQRETIELLFGITKLSEKADRLKEIIKETKDRIKEEEFRIKGITDSNAMIERNIEQTIIKRDKWVVSHAETIETVKAALITLNELNVDDELAKHQMLADIETLTTQKDSLLSDIKAVTKEIAQINKNKTHSEISLSKLQLNVCPSCEQQIGAHKHEELQSMFAKEVADYEQELVGYNLALAELQQLYDEIQIPAKPTTFYQNIKDVYDHAHQINNMSAELERELTKTNPYLEQEDMLRASIQTVDYSLMNDLTRTKDHQEFLLKLLTNKDSFIRKKIIEQNLSHLNTRLSTYLEMIGLPHAVVFQPNLEVAITEYGRDMDFTNLSRGERTRLILALAWAFRDIYESMNSKFNLLFVDEYLDWGLDTSGIESTLSVLNLMAREQNRNVFLISHREELVGKVDYILNVKKENGFTTFNPSEL